MGEEGPGQTLFFVWNVLVTNSKFFDFMTETLSVWKTFFYKGHYYASLKSDAILEFKTNWNTVIGTYTLQSTHF